MQGLVVKAALLIITAWQRVLSPIFGERCRFYPSCSEYAKQALLKHGPAKGITFALKRVMHCGPWHQGGIDPVP